MINKNQNIFKIMMIIIMLVSL